MPRDVTPHQAAKIFYDDEEQSIRKTADNNSITEDKGEALAPEHATEACGAWS
jgi:hypothetical protein